MPRESEKNARRKAFERLVSDRWKPMVGDIVWRAGVGVGMGACGVFKARVYVVSMPFVCIEWNYGHRRRTAAVRHEVLRPVPPRFSRVARLQFSKSIEVLTASQPFTTAVVMSNRPWFRYEWILRKNRPTGFLDARRRPLKDHESALVFCERRPAYHPQMRVGKKHGIGGNAASAVYHRYGSRPRGESAPTHGAGRSS